MPKKLMEQNLTIHAMASLTCICRRRQVGCSDLEECSILLSVVVLFPCMFPRDPKDGFFIIFPNQAGISPAVDLIDQPLSQFAVAAAD